LVEEMRSKVSFYWLQLTPKVSKIRCHCAVHEFLDLAFGLIEIVLVIN
jgi:hypothetical protein